MDSEREAVVRPATLDDVPGIARVHVDAWRETYADIIAPHILASQSYERREAQWSGALSDPARRIHLSVMQVESGAISGFVAVGPEGGVLPDYDGELYAIYLLQRYQGGGYGRQLFASGARALGDKGFRSLVLWVLEANPARGFYEHLGGSIVDRKILPVGDEQYPAVAYGWAELPDG
ncbi:MAG: GNAT family N-acetyltransferase [Candidatus Promineifilaceae bacterium]|nr:GNAT family N-acetyltransferase [Candidatus Promineifilaceae bacterium]